MDLDDKLIIVEDGDVFYGNAIQFAECFFTNVNRESVTHWAATEGFKLVIVDKVLMADGYSTNEDCL